MSETYFQDAEIQAMIDATGGLSTTIGSTTANCLVDRVDEEMMRSGGWSAYIGKAVVVTLRTNAFPSIAIGQTVTIAGSAKTYKVRQVMQDGDGGTSRTLCAED